MKNVIELTSSVSIKVYRVPGFDKYLNQNNGNNLSTGIFCERTVIIMDTASLVRTDRVKMFNDNIINTLCNTIN